MVAKKAAKKFMLVCVTNLHRRSPFSISYCKVFRNVKDCMTWFGEIELTLEPTEINRQVPYATSFTLLPNVAGQTSACSIILPRICSETGSFCFVSHERVSTRQLFREFLCSTSSSLFETYLSIVVFSYNFITWRSEMAHGNLPRERQSNNREIAYKLIHGYSMC